MRTARLAVFASLFLSLLGGCAGAGDVGLQVHPPASNEVPPAAQAAATDFSPQPPEVAVLPENGGEEAPGDAEPVPLATAPGGASSPEAYTFDPSRWQESLGSLTSFRQKAVLDFTAAGSRVRSKVTYEGEVTLDPDAFRSRVRVEGQGAAQLPADRVEVTSIDDRVWVKLGLKPWVAMPASAVQNMYGGEVVGVADLLPFVHGARRSLPDETVNGIPSRHYVYDLDNLQADVGMSTAAGDLWVALDGGYVVRLTLEGQGTYYNTYTASGTLRLIYDLYDVDVPLTIYPPR
jgi:hypothetical protein